MTTPPTEPPAADQGRSTTTPPTPAQGADQQFWSTTTPPTETPGADQHFWSTTSPPTLAQGADQHFWSTTTPPTEAAGPAPPGDRSRSAQLMADHGRRILFAAIAAVVALTVIGGGLLVGGLLSDDEPTETADDPTESSALVGWPAALTLAVPAEAAGGAEGWALVPILADELGIAVQIQSYDDASAIADALASQDAGLAMLDPIGYVGAIDAGAQIRPAGIEAAGLGDVGYVRTLGITRASNTEINSLGDAAGQVVCFADRTSTAGYLFPAAGLAEVGVDAGAQSSLVAGDHEAAVDFVADGTCPVSFALEEVVLDLVASGTVSGVVDASGEGQDVNAADAELKIIWTSPPIANDPLVIGTWLPQDLQDMVIRVVTESANRDEATRNGYCDDAATCQVSTTPWGYMPATDADFEGYRQVCQLPEMAEICGR